jgi:outer membrane PBP1 activator LpoA protein
MIASLRRATPRHEIEYREFAAATAARTVFRAQWIIALAAVVFITACGPLQMQDTGDEAPSGPTSAAESLSRQGRHQAAADLYLQLAQSAEPIARQRYLILTAAERRLAGNPEVAQTILDRLGQPIAESNQLLWSQVAAEISIAMGNAAQALVMLESAPPAIMSADAVNILRIRSGALFRLGRPLEATEALLEREVWLDSRAEIAANQLLLWESYQTWGSKLANVKAGSQTDPRLLGWLALGEIAWTSRTAPTSMRLALLAWQQDFPKHAANDLLIPEILGDLPATQAFPQRVAVLLPLTGRQSGLAEAIRDGFMAAHFTQSDLPDPPMIRFYDVTVNGVSAAYAQAIAEGAMFVVGPLLKESVQELSASRIVTPTLSLNFLPEESVATPAFFQFSLSPEDEARQVAQRAVALGQLRALALAPNNAWGRRLLTSFTAQFEAGGGQILDYRFYDANSPDFSSGIQSLLLISESRARKDRLAANLGVSLEYEPRRRADLDLIFLAATANAGKLIRPQLRFHYAGSVPTYSTSAIYQEGSMNNADLNGIMFPDIPWLIAPDGQSVAVRDTIARHWPNQAQKRSRLYALGFDAYRLIPVVNAAAGGNTADVEGMTGTLYIDDRGRVLRRLPWARMQSGKPELMEPLRVERGEVDEETGISTLWQSTSNMVAPPSN